MSRRVVAHHVSFPDRRSLKPLALAMVTLCGIAATSVLAADGEPPAATGPGEVIVVPQQPEEPEAPAAAPQPAPAPKPTARPAGQAKPLAATGAPAKPTTTARNELTKREQDVVDANPEHDLVICMAGCGSGPPRILFKRPKLGENDSGNYIGLAAVKNTPGTGGTAQTEDEVICIAGCNGAAGTVIWRGMKVAWLGETSRDQLMAALREVHEQLKVDRQRIANGRRWMTTEAREELDRALSATP